MNKVFVIICWYSDGWEVNEEVVGVFSSLELATKFCLDNDAVPLTHSDYRFHVDNDSPNVDGGYDIKEFVVDKVEEL